MTYDGTGNKVIPPTGFAAQIQATFDTATALNGALPDNPWRYAGGALDSTGLYHFGARYYDPAIGRWTQQDSVVSLGDPGNGNRYAYAGDDPVNNVDSTGAKPKYVEKCVTGAGQGALVKGAVGLIGGPETAAAGFIEGAAQGCATGLASELVGYKFGESKGKAVEIGGNISDALEVGQGIGEVAAKL